MISVKENVALLTYNTFGIPAYARFFIELNDVPSVEEFLRSDFRQRFPLFILGGGSNVLFTKDFAGTIIHPVIHGIEVLSEDSKHIIIRAGAGEVWDNLVSYCVEHSWSGIENLSWIPGMTGACPVQNIGAYGVEVMDFINTVEGFLIQTGEKIILTAKECRFSYRNSIFKNELKNKVLITHVTFLLNKKPVFNTQYPDLKKELNQFDETTVDNIRQAVISIRMKKLPDPAETGNAGSFFKNPVIPEEHLKRLRSFYPAMPAYILDDGTAKLSAAWLIEQSGWKGKNYGKAGTHARQPLIIINRGGASGVEILEFALKIQKAVMNHFGIRLEMEVNVL